MIKLSVLKNRLSGILSVGHPSFWVVSSILSVGHPSFSVVSIYCRLGTRVFQLPQVYCRLDTRVFQLSRVYCQLWVSHPYPRKFMYAFSSQLHFSSKFPPSVMHVYRIFRFMPTNAYTHNKSLISVFLLFILNLSSCFTKNYTQI